MNVKRFGYAIVFLILLASGISFGQLNPAQSSATSYITYNTRGFLIDGKPLYIYSGEIEFVRIPQALWRDRLMRMKREGYNCASTYIFWDAHEPIQGQYNFSGNQDLDAWLTLVQEMGMYAIVRAGPYVCAEWDFGGFPAWLVDVSSMSLRNSNAQYLSCVDSFYTRLIPIIAKHQISQGGSVIAIQLENEYGPSTTDQVYKSHLISEAGALGINVPYIWSETNNGNAPAPSGAFQSGPWFSTEAWDGWISGYGEPAQSYITNVLQGTWNCLSRGSAGITNYMAIGGTNFGYSASDDQRITSYDYEAPLGELGQLRSDFWLVKQMGLFAQTFSPILASSSNGSSLVSGTPSGSSVYVHQAGTAAIAFVVKTSSGTAAYKITWTNKSNLQVPTTWNDTLTQNHYAHYFLNSVPINGNDTIDFSATGITGIRQIGSTTYVVLWGRSGTKGEIAFRPKSLPSPIPSSPWQWNAAANQAYLAFTYPPVTDSVTEATLTETNGQTLKLLIVDSAQGNQTWIDTNFIACGPLYVDAGDNLQFGTSGGRAFVYTAAGRQIVTKGASTPSPNLPLTSGWSWRSVVEVGASYNDSLWQQSTSPQTMSSYGCPNGYCWYRTSYIAAAAGTATLALPKVHQAAFVYVNGTYCSGSSIPLVAGKNEIAILCAEYNRWKAYNYYSTITDTMKSGILGSVTLNGTALTGWHCRGGFDGFPESLVFGNVDSISWNSFLAGSWSATAAPADNIPKFWRRNFTYSEPANALETWTLRSTVARSGRGVVWLNGHCLGRNLESQPALFVPQCWFNPTETNTLIVLTEDGKQPQNDTLGLVEYRSLVSLPGITTATRPSGGAVIPAVVSAADFQVRFFGNCLVIPKALRGSALLVRIYDLSGRLIIRKTVRQSIIELTGKDASAHAVHVAQIEKLPVDSRSQ